MKKFVIFILLIIMFYLIVVLGIQIQTLKKRWNKDNLEQHGDKIEQVIEQKSSDNIIQNEDVII